MLKGTINAGKNTNNNFWSLPLAVNDEQLSDLKTTKKYSEQNTTYRKRELGEIKATPQNNPIPS